MALRRQIINDTQPFCRVKKQIERRAERGEGEGRRECGDIHTGAASAV